MNLLKRHLFPLLLAVLLCLPMRLNAGAFTDLGTQPIELGDRIVVTVGADQAASFTYTPPQNVRCNIYQDCDQYMTLVHIAPFHMDSAQQHWSDDSPRKGIYFSMKAGVTYTMQIAMPGHFEGGTFTVYFDLVEWLPDDYFSSGASWDDVGNPQPDATPEPTSEPEPVPEPEPTPSSGTTSVGIEVTSPLTTPFTFGCEDYGRLEEPDRYVFSPANYKLYEGLVFDILYSDGSRETVTWNNLSWPSGTEYNPESWDAFYRDYPVLVIPFVNGEKQFFPSFDSPGPVTFLVDCGGMTDSFTVDLLSAEGSSPEADPNQPADDPPISDGPAIPDEPVIPNPFEQPDLFLVDLSFWADLGIDMTVQGAEFTVSLDPAALQSIAQQAGEDSQLILRAEHSTPDRLTEPQQQALNSRRYVALVDVSLFCDDQTIHQLGGTATVTVPFSPDEGTDPTHYTVYYLAEDGALEPMPTTFGDGSITFTTEHFSVYTVLYEEPTEAPTVSPEPSVEPAPVSTPSTGLILGLVAGAAVIVAVLLLLLRRKNSRKS